MSNDGPDDSRRKLVAVKEQWAAEGRGLTGHSANPTHQRLPPGQHLTTDWPVLDLGVQPAIDLKDWKLTINGLVENPLIWEWEEFMAQPQIEDCSDMHCVTTWSRYDNQWQGVSARHLLALARPRPEVRFVSFKSHDAYTTNVPLNAFDDADVLLAHHWEGKPIPREHGGPVRVIIPKLYLWKSAKWLRSITFLEKDQPGFWEVRGYHNNGDPWTEERYS